MKRVGNLWDKITSYDNLVLAHKMARKDKTYYYEVKMVDRNPKYYLTKIQKMLKHHSYVVSDYTVQLIDDKGKERKLMKLKYFPDRIIQWAILLQLEKTFLNTFCSHTCASIPGRGNGRVIKLMNRYLKDEYNTRYCIQVDMKKFYDNVNHEILKTMLRKKIKDLDLLWLLDLIIDSYPGDKGVPIGSYLSQYLANFYLCYFDHYLKEDLHVKCVIRYMDDIVIFCSNKTRARYVFKMVRHYAKKHLKLRVKGNWQIYNVNTRGVSFVGYRYFRHFTLVSQKTAKRFKLLCGNVWCKMCKHQFISRRQFCGVNSYLGILKPADTYRLKQHYIQPIVPALLRFYLYNVKRSIYSFNRYKKKLLINLCVPLTPELC